MADKVSLCNDCGVAQKDGTPCGIMLTKDVVEVCSRYEKDANKHKALVDKQGSKKEAKEVK